jgi:hypothetical protein
MHEFEHLDVQTTYAATSKPTPALHAYRTCLHSNRVHMLLCRNLPKTTPHESMHTQQAKQTIHAATPKTYPKWLIHESKHEMHMHTSKAYICTLHACMQEWDAPTHKPTWSCMHASAEMHILRACKHVSRCMYTQAPGPSHMPQHVGLPRFLRACDRWDDVHTYKLSAA